MTFALWHFDDYILECIFSFLTLKEMRIMCHIQPRFKKVILGMGPFMRERMQVNRPNLYDAAVALDRVDMFLASTNKSFILASDVVRQLVTNQSVCILETLLETHEFPVCSTVLFAAVKKNCANVCKRIVRRYTKFQNLFVDACKTYERPELFMEVHLEISTHESKIKECSIDYAIRHDMKPLLFLWLQNETLSIHTRNLVYNGHVRRVTIKKLFSFYLFANEFREVIRQVHSFPPHSVGKHKGLLVGNDPINSPINQVLVRLLTVFLPSFRLLPAVVQGFVLHRAPSP